MAETKKETLFDKLNSIDVNSKTEKKGNLTYLSWAWAWAEFKKVCPDGVYEVKKFDGLPYVYDPNTGFMVYTSVTANGVTHEMWLPVMDSRNRALKQATMFEINKTIMRCLTKNLAMFGLGLYIYAGEDLPEDAPKETAAETKAAATKASGLSDATKAAISEAVKSLAKSKGYKMNDILASLAKPENVGKPTTEYTEADAEKALSLLQTWALN